MSQFFRDYPSFMMKDLLFEFRQEFNGTDGKTESLIKALAAQFTELLEAFNDIEQKTVLGDDYPKDKEIGEYAIGKQLDGVGDIVALTRKEASILSNQICTASQIDPTKLSSFSDFSVFGPNGEKIAETFEEYLSRAENAQIEYIIPEEVSEGSTKENPYAICDNLYRDYLKHKVFLINSTATYRDVMKNIRMFWQPKIDENGVEREVKIRYEEWPERPGAIVLSTEVIKPENNARLYFMIPVIKAAGVELLRMATTEYPRIDAPVYIAPYLYNCLIQCTLPPIIEPTKHTALLYPYAEDWNVMDTGLKGEFEKTGNLNGIYRLFNANTAYHGAEGKRPMVVPVKKPEVIGSVVVPAFIDGYAITQLLGTFAICTEITELYLPETLKYIGVSSFVGCTNLKYIEMYIPEQINYSAFSGCTSLEMIYFKGTKSQFESIRFVSPSSAGKKVFDNAHIITFEGEITDD